MADNVAITPGSGATVSTEEISTLNGGAVSAQHIQRVIPATRTADSTAIDEAAGAGAVSTSTKRVTLASDDPAVTALQIIDDWDESDRAKVNPIVGQAGVAAGAGAVGVTTQRVTLASDDPAVTALQILDNAISGSEMQVDVVTSALPTGASTLTEQQTQTTHLATIAGDTTDIEAAVELIDDTVATLGTTTYSEATTKGLIVGAVRRDADTTLVDTTNEVGPLQMNAAGQLKVEVFSGETLPVSLASVPSHAVTNAGTFAVQVDGAALTALQLIDDTVFADDAAFTPASSKVNAIGFFVDDTATDSVNEGDIGAPRMSADRIIYVQGAVAHDAADSGNPIKTGAKASATLSDDTMAANADRVDNVADLDGALLVRPQVPLGDLISEALSNTDGASTASTNFGATASTRSYISAIHAFRTDAGTTPIYIDFRDGTAGSVLYRVVLPPNGGVVLPAGAVPYFRTSANTALAFDVSAATSTVYINLTGFKSKV